MSALIKTVSVHGGGPIVVNMRHVEFVSLQEVDVEDGKVMATCFHIASGGAIEAVEWAFREVEKWAVPPDENP